MRQTMRTKGARLPVFINNSLVGEASWIELVNFCTAQDLEQHVATSADGSAYLRLPGAYCEPQGVKPVLQWMRKAFASSSHDIIPVDLLKPGAWSILDLCCIELALSVFGRQKEASALQSFLHRTLQERQLSINELSEALQALPSGSYWVNKLLKHIYDRLHDDRIRTWVSNTGELPELMWQRYLAQFGQYCEEETRQRIDAWVLKLEDAYPLPLGEFPHSRPANRRIPTLKRLGAISGNLRLEWSDTEGGCYIETEPSVPSYGMRPYGKQKSTKIGRLWLRRYDGSDNEAADEPVLPTVEPGVRRVDSGIGSLTPLAIPRAWQFR